MRAAFVFCLLSCAAPALVLVAHPSVPARNIRELVALAKKMPGRLNMAIAGATGEIAGNAMMLQAGVDWKNIPYKGGAPSQPEYDFSQAPPQDAARGRALYDELQKSEQRRGVRAGARLQQEAGLRKGDRIAIMLPNVLQYPIALFGALRAGLIVVNTNPLLNLLRRGPIQLGTINRVPNLEAHAEGKGVNVARVLGRLGHRVIVTGFAGGHAGPGGSAEPPRPGRAAPVSPGRAAG